MRKIGPNRLETRDTMWDHTSYWTHARQLFLKINLHGQEWLLMQTQQDWPHGLGKCLTKAFMDSNSQYHGPKLICENAPFCKNDRYGQKWLKCKLRRTGLKVVGHLVSNSGFWDMGQWTTFAKMTPFCKNGRCGQKWLNMQDMAKTPQSQEPKTC